MDEQVNLERYEQRDLDRPTEAEFFDRANSRLDEAMRHLAETEDRMARNAGGDPKPEAGEPASRPPVGSDPDGRS